MLSIPMSNRIEDRVNGPSRLPVDEDWNPDALERWSAWNTANPRPQPAQFSSNAPMTPYRFSQRSWRNLESVHPKLCVLMGRAISYAPYDFTIIEGLRTKIRQAELLEKRNDEDDEFKASYGSRRRRRNMA